MEYLVAKADDDAWLRPSPYLKRLDTILTAILESPCYSDLFTAEELTIARNFLPDDAGGGKLSSNARELYARLLGRRPCWFRVLKLLRSYGKERFARSAGVVLTCLRELSEQGLVAKLGVEHGTEEALVALNATLDLETLRNPKVVPRDTSSSRGRQLSGVKRGGKEELLGMLRRRMGHGKKSAFGTDPFRATLHVLEKGLRDELLSQGDYGLTPQQVWAVIVRREPGPADLFRRLIRLYLSSSVGALREPISTCVPMRWCADLLSAFGIVKFEPYRHEDKGLRLWDSRAAFVGWERACELRFVVGEWGARREGQETGDLEEAVERLLGEWEAEEGRGGKGGKRAEKVKKEEEEDGEWEVWEEIEGGGKGLVCGPMRVLAFARGVLEERARHGEEAGRRRDAMRQALGEVVVLLDDEEEGEGQGGCMDEGSRREGEAEGSVDSEGMAAQGEEGVPSFLSSFHSESVLVEMLSDAVMGGGGYSRRIGAGEGALGREERMAILRLLLQLPYCVHKRGRWWEELCKQAEGRTATQATLRACAQEAAAVWEGDQGVVEEEEEREALLEQGPRGLTDALFPGSPVIMPTPVDLSCRPMGLEAAKALQVRRRQQAVALCALALQDPHVGGADRMCLMRRLARCHKALQPKPKASKKGQAAKRPDGPTDMEGLLSEGSSRDSAGSSSSSHSNSNSNLDVGLGLDTWHDAPSVSAPLPGQEEGEAGTQTPACLSEGRAWTREETFLKLQWPVAFSATVSETFDGTRQNCETGVKSRVVSSLEGQVLGGDVYTGVESLALELYASEEHGGYWGVHDEGTILRTLFGLLFWDVIFLDDAASLPGAFLSGYQSGPLDLLLHSPWVFYDRRRGAIDALLSSLSAMSGEEVAGLVYERWVGKQGVQCVGVSWRAVPLQVLQAVAMGLGGCRLSRAFKPLLVHYRAFSGGLPDLLLLRVEDGDRVLQGKELAKWMGVQEEVLQKLCLGGVLIGEGEDGEGLEERGEREEGEEKQDEAPGRLSNDQEYTVRVRLVEVKGPNDTLMETQKAWMVVLQNAGVDVSVCRLKDSAAATQQRGIKRKSKAEE